MTNAEAELAQHTATPTYRFEDEFYFLKLSPDDNNIRVISKERFVLTPLGEIYGEHGIKLSQDFQNSDDWQGCEDLAYTYWNGHNFCSIVISDNHEFFNHENLPEVLKGDELAKYVKILECSHDIGFEKDQYGTKYCEHDEWQIEDMSTSKWQGAFGDFIIRPIDAF
jgi:hypothetical protein